METVSELTLTALSVFVFILHLAGYALYTINTLREEIRPNAASWLMWMFGGLVEYTTYEAIDEQTWFSSSLPIACLIGLTMIFIATAYVELRNHFYRQTSQTVFHPPKWYDYGLISFDACAGLIWIILKMPTLANILAVSSSIVTFTPIWRTTLETGEEKAGPWALWCLAYAGMGLIIVLEGGESILQQLFYPFYYFVLHGVVLMLCYKSIRRYFHNLIKLS